MTAARGLVTQTAPLRVRLDGSATDAPANTMSGYSPAVADRVLVLAVGSSLVVLGREVAA